VRELCSSGMNRPIPGKKVSSFLLYTSDADGIAKLGIL